MKITAREWSLAIIFGILGFLVTTKTFLYFLLPLNPFYNFLIYYAIVFLSLFILSKLGLTVFNIKIESLKQIIGTTLIIFSFFLIFNFENPYVQYISTGSLSGASPIFFGSEDGVSWWMWSHIFSGIQVLRIFAFSITPLILALLGGLLIERKPKLPTP